MRQILLLLAFSSATVASAVSPQAESAARELVEILKVDEPLRELQKFTTTMSAIVRPSKKEPTPKSSPEMELLTADLKKRAVEIYTAEFTEVELVDMLTFFRSPTGARYLEKQPEIARSLRRYLTEAPPPKK
jgi:hypothetical protein